ncbi:MAG TPA: glycoside hydrolase family 3 N-terminal domain-containing protein, partial [Candidatus Saccharimonadales bacterium]|nr:glycoside hydrolase family 3 N-terminal domain-containing protein [Candidatus Saccharimonadales bacterium]
MTGSSPHESPHGLGQILFIGIEGGSLTEATRGLLEEVRPGGVILFRRNVPSLPDLAALCSAIRDAVDPAPFIAVDEEGGRVTRLEPHVTGLPSAVEAASAGTDKLETYWRAYGTLLATLGFDIDFAPVVDLCPADAANGIADRSFGISPDAVIAGARAVMSGLTSAGVLPTLKHFPGLGPTLLDSHHHLPSLTKPKESFEREDLAPFEALAREAPLVMIGHGHYPFYSGPDPIAATLSEAISGTLLRERIGFGGVAVSDDLEMKAVSARIPWDDLAPRAVAAGNDMLLICHRPERIVAARDALARRAASDESF